MVNKKPSEFALQFENLCAFIDFFEIKHSTAMQLCADFATQDGRIRLMNLELLSHLGLEIATRNICVSVGWLVSFFVGFFRKPKSPPKKIEIHDQIHEMW